VFSPSTADAAAYEYDVASGNFVGTTGLTPRKGACEITVPAGKGYAIELAQAGLADAIVAVDFVTTANALSYAGLSARRSNGDEIYTTFDTTTGAVGVWQQMSGKRLQVTGGAAWLDSTNTVHRLVLSVIGGHESTWLDDQAVGQGDAVAVTRTGGIEAYFANSDTSITATFDLLRFVVYQSPS
jgi:hypothetical protein